MISTRKLAFSLAAATALAATGAPAQARAGANCVGIGASLTMGGGVLQALAILGGMLFGTEIAATHCDPSFD